MARRNKNKHVHCARPIAMAARSSYKGARLERQVLMYSRYIPGFHTTLFFAVNFDSFPTDYT